MPIGVSKPKVGFRCFRFKSNEINLLSLSDRENGALCQSDGLMGTRVILVESL